MVYCLLLNLLIDSFATTRGGHVAPCVCVCVCVCLCVCVCMCVCVCVFVFVFVWAMVSMASCFLAARLQQIICLISCLSSRRRRRRRRQLVSRSYESIQV